MNDRNQETLPGELHPCCGKEELGDGPQMGAGQCDRMCADCSKTCTRDWGHSGPHRCDTHGRY
jgi:hypothetical protein